MSLDEIVLPTTEPETEWVRGRALQKMSPQFDHGRVQFKFANRLDEWGSRLGHVATEWRFRIAIPGEARRPLVPDVAFVTNDRLRGMSRKDLQSPAIAPTLAVEILSIGDDPRDVASKIDVYLRGGGELVIVIDPQARTMSTYDRSGDPTRFSNDDRLEHAALPGFSIELAAFFRDALDVWIDPFSS